MITNPINKIKLKYSSLRFAEKIMPHDLFGLIELCKLEGGRKRVLIDYKVQNLIKGMHTCISGWHRDTICDVDAVHHLYIIGQPTTEFKINNSAVSIPEQQWYKYTNDLHRGPLVKKDCERTLIRITETNLVMPRNSIL